MILERAGIELKVCTCTYTNLDCYLQYLKVLTHFKGIVSRDFGGLQMILINRIGVPDVPLEVYSFLNFCFHIVI